MRNPHPLVALLMCLPAASHAQVVTDPTRPPIGAHVSAADPADRSSVADARQPRPPAVPASAPQLQSIQRPAKGAANALVDGRLVRVGDRIGDQTIVAIDAHGMQLRGTRGALQTMTLLGGVNKTPSLGSIDISQALAAGPRKNTP